VGSSQLWLSVLLEKPKFRKLGNAQLPAAASQTAVLNFLDGDICVFNINRNQRIFSPPQIVTNWQQRRDEISGSQFAVW